MSGQQALHMASGSDFISLIHIRGESVYCIVCVSRGITGGSGWIWGRAFALCVERIDFQQVIAKVCDAFGSGHFYEM